VDLFTLQMAEMHLTGIKNGEKAADFGSFGANDLIIGDRAYGTLQSIEYQRSRGSDFVQRIRSDAFVVYTAEKRRVELAGYFAGHEEHESGEVQLYYKFGAFYRPIRICGTRKSEKRAGEYTKDEG
jgi:hypothetical protein